MKYFEQYLVDANSLDDIDISVHCDIKIFEWLMRYLKDSEEPNLDVKNVISILISSDFLGMQQLVDDCVLFIKRELPDIVRLPIDMGCLNSNLIKKIANAVTMEELVNLRDKKDKLTSRIYMKKLESMIESEYFVVYRCVFCNQLFTQEQREWMVCPKAKIFIDFHGSVIAKHVVDRYWECNKFIQFMQKENVPWREIYWKIWARLQTFNCAECDSPFVGAELEHCSYHTSKPKFNYGNNVGVFPCCN